MKSLETLWSHFAFKWYSELPYTPTPPPVQTAPTNAPKPSLHGFAYLDFLPKEELNSLYL